MVDNAATVVFKSTWPPGGDGGVVKFVLAFSVVNISIRLPVGSDIDRVG